jgi:hypothetical protein
MRAGIKRLLQCSDQDETSEDDVISIVFIIRIIEALHASFYASFRSLWQICSGTSLACRN